LADDILIDVANLISTNWDQSNTNGRTPTISDISEVKRVSLNSGDFIFIWELIYTPEDNASGGQSKKTQTFIMLDIRTAKSRAQFVSMRKELRRVLNDAQIDVFTDSVYDISDIMEETDMSSKMVGLWRSQTKWRLEQLNLAV
jgi:hypothetical protein